MTFVSNKKDNTDTLAYVTRLIGSDTGATSDSFHLIFLPS